MAILKFCRFWLLCFFCTATYAASINQTLQINTRFTSIVGKPTWLIILRDINSGQVLPYQFDIKNNDNFWIAFSTERVYRVTASYLNFGPYAKIANFCKLENGILDGKSIFVTVTGALTPAPSTSKCSVVIRKDVPFTVPGNE